MFKWKWLGEDSAIYTLIYTQNLDFLPFFFLRDEKNVPV